VREVSCLFLVSSMLKFKAGGAQEWRELGGSTISVTHPRKKATISELEEDILAHRKTAEKQPKNKEAANSCSLLSGLSHSQALRQKVTYWLSGLKVRIPASVLEQTPAGSTRTTASSSAQKARIPVWLMVIGTPTTV